MTRALRVLGLLTSATSLAFLWAGCSPDSDARVLAGAVADLHTVGSYKASYVVITRIEGAARPIVGQGVLELRFPDRAISSTGDLQTISIGNQVWTRIGGSWQQAAMAALPLDPYLYLAAAAGVKSVEGGRYRFRVDVPTYRIALERRIGALPHALAEQLSVFAAEGEVSLGRHGLPEETVLRIKDVGPSLRAQIAEVTIRFLEFGQASDVHAPETADP